jgi:hypothetical protein
VVVMMRRMMIIAGTTIGGVIRRPRVNRLAYG